MFKKTFAIVIGVLSGIVIIYIGDATTHALNPPPIGINYLDKNIMNQYVANIPDYILLLMVAFWLLASFMGGWVAGLLNRAEWRSASASTGGILLAATVLNLVMISHPLWMWVSAIAGILPFSYFGGLLAIRRPTRPLA